MTMTAQKISLDEPELLVEVVNHAGVLTLNRPKALNALSLGMIRKMYQALLDWKEDPQIHYVIIEGAGEKAFCAGGDIRSVYLAKQKRDKDFGEAIFREEYHLNHLIHTFPKPYISIIDGICMGGGLGISIHGSHRIVTEKSVLAMPETTIGFFPDIGAGYFLNQCPGQLGIWMGILGEKITASDAIYTNLATHYVLSEQIPSLKMELLNATLNTVDDILKKYEETPSKSDLETLSSFIEETFHAPSIEKIIQNLEKTPHPKADEWLALLKKKSPTSLKISLESLHRACGKSIKEVLQQEFRLSQRCVEGHDFCEGIRALLIDKDQNPQWIPSSLNQVTPEIINHHFSLLEEKELIL